MKRQLNGLLSRWNIQFFYSGTYICIRQPLYSLVNYAKLKYSTGSAGLIQCLPVYHTLATGPPPKKKEKKEKIKSYCIKYKESINNDQILGLQASCSLLIFYNFILYLPVNVFFMY